MAARSAYVRGFDERVGQSGHGPDDDAPFAPKHIFSLKNNTLSGVTLGQWRAILRRYGHQIEWRVYWLRALFVSVMALFNSILAFVENRLYGLRVREMEDWLMAHRSEVRPVFILGHPRTGTTLLHNLLALDEQRFTYCSTFTAGFPSSFLMFERVGKRLLAGLLDQTRPMDNMPLDFDLPGEDELGTCLLANGVSPYTGTLYFMHNEHDYRPFFALREAHPTDQAQWRTAFLHLIAKLLVRDEIIQGGTRRKIVGGAANDTGRLERVRVLLLKSPCHTARVQLLRDIFPGAQFLYVHRDPYEVYASAEHMADSTYWFTTFQILRVPQVREFILAQFELLYSEYSNSQARKKDAVEIAYSDLERDPENTVVSIYERCGWKMSENMRARLHAAVCETSFKTYRRNIHKQLPAHLRAVISMRWRPYIDRFGYTR